MPVFYEVNAFNKLSAFTVCTVKDWFVHLDFLCVLRETRTKNWCSWWEETHWPHMLPRLPLSLLLFLSMDTLTGMVMLLELLGVKLDLIFKWFLEIPSWYTISRAFQFLVYVISVKVYLQGTTLLSVVLSRTVSILEKKKHFIGKVWVKWAFFSPCWYWGFDWNKHALSWKPNHMKKGASWGGRSSTNSAVGIGRYHRSQISTLPLCWEPAPHSFTLILLSSCKYRQHQFIHRVVTEPRRQKVHCMLAVRWRWYRPQEVALLLAWLLKL